MRPVRQPVRRAATAIDATRVLVLQGGGALGSYQAGVFEALSDSNLCPEWIAGISIGAINAALIAGNPPERRVERLHEFWDLVTSAFTLAPLVGNDTLRGGASQMAAAWAMVGGAPGFFRPMWPPVVPWLQGPIAWYDTRPLRETLERLIDWDLINHGPVRLSVGAVNVMTGNFRYFDSARERLGPEHVMASGALPPGFPPVEIDGCWWWDGGLVSNTPLEHVLDSDGQRDLLVFQVDLFPARGPLPGSIVDAEERAQDIRYSSRTRFNTDASLRLARARAALRRLIDKLPPELRDSEDVRLLARAAHESRVAVAQLIYRDRAWQGASKGYEFSRATMLDHWQLGRDDVLRNIAGAEWLALPLADGMTAYDLSRPELPARR